MCMTPQIHGTLAEMPTWDNDNKEGQASKKREEKGGNSGSKNRAK